MVVYVVRGMDRGLDLFRWGWKDCGLNGERRVWRRYAVQPRKECNTV